jgi:hypothetical protein
VVETVTLVSGNNNQGFGTLLVGDANNDNRVNISDFTILAATFGKSLGMPGYDARADLNGDNNVNISDFTLLASNFGKVGQNP